ncbi:MAG: MBL fold metallo-hydrolase [Kurthia sp.]|nr:MBL fold metallo-hydrolase [Candidatus Kurthia equi]
MLNIRKYALGPVQTNCYIISNAQHQCLIIDPGEQGKKIISEIRKANLTPEAILLTHAHFDHIGAVDEVRDTFSIPVYMHKKEQSWLGDATLNGSAKYAQLPNYEVKSADEFLTPSKEVTVGSFNFEVVHTPGHSPGSISFLFHEDRLAFVGDTLFKGSIGRTDLIGGDTKLLLKSIQMHLLNLPEDTIIYPGHDEATTIADEMKMNPFLKGL